MHPCYSLILAFISIITKICSVDSEPTTLEKSPKFAAQTFRTWNNGSIHKAANRSRKIDSDISFPISGAILLKSWKVRKIHKNCIIDQCFILMLHNYHCIKKLFNVIQQNVSFIIYLKRNIDVRTIILRNIPLM